MAVVRSTETRDLWQHSTTDAANPGIHPVTDDVAIEKITRKSEVLTIFHVKVVGRIKGSKITNDTGFLNISAAAAPTDWWRTQAIRSGPVAAKAFCFAEFLLKRLQEGGVQNEACLLYTSDAADE